MKQNQSAANLADERTNKDKLLDAAEQLFASKGFDATTTREITREAGVPLGLMSYYFGTKKELYTEIIKRRSEEHLTDIADSLKQAKARAAGRELTFRELVLAYWRPIIAKCVGRGAGWRSYVQLLVRAASAPAASEAYIVAFPETYLGITNALIDIIREMYPDAEPADVYWVHYIMNSTMNHMVMENDRVDFVSGGLCKAEDLETILEKVATLYEGGVGSLLGKRQQAMAR